MKRDSSVKMIRTTEDIIDELKDKAKEAIDTLNQVLADLTIIEDNYKELESEKNDLNTDNEQLEDEKQELEDELDSLKEDKGEPLDTLRKIIDKAENWDYGMKGWRTLETKQDLINAIKKEVL